jgi:carboxylate-amine ligase
MSDSLPFHPQHPFTIGAELEVRLVDAQTLMPANRSAYLFRHLDEALQPYVHKELLQSMIEIVTPVCKSADEVVDFIGSTLQRLARIAESEGILLAALATHPFETSADNEIHHDPRYEAFAQELQIILADFLISGLHIHIAMPDAQAALHAYNATIKYMPIFLALCANSPYYLGEDTGLHSYRTEIFQQLPRAGIPQSFDSYDTYQQLMAQLKGTGTIESIKDVWWDVRIHETFGTIEMRVCDAFYEPERLRLIVLFYQSLLIYATRHPIQPEFAQIARQNKWSAVRHAMEGKFIDGFTVKTIRDTARALVRKIAAEGIFEQLNATDAITPLLALMDRAPISQKLRIQYKKTGDLRDVIRSQTIDPKAISS